MLRAFVAVVLCCVAFSTAGCGRKKAWTETSGNSPMAAASGFAEALRTGNLDEAAGYWAYDTEAKAQNEDWDSIPSGQRQQIKSKVRQDRIKSLKPLVDAVKQGKGALHATGNGPKVAVIDDNNATVLIVTVAQEGSGYKVSASETPCGR